MFDKEETSKKHHHYHLYKRVNIGSKKPHYVFKCFSTACPEKKTHYILPVLMEGMEILCWKCKEPTAATKKMCGMVRPKCALCQSGTKIENILDDISELIRKG